MPIYGAIAKNISESTCGKSTRTLMVTISYFELHGLIVSKLVSSNPGSNCYPMMGFTSMKIYVSVVGASWSAL